MKYINKAFPALLFLLLFYSNSFGQIGRMSATRMSYNALNAIPKSAGVRQHVVNVSNGLNAGSYTMSPFRGQTVNTGVIAILAAKESVTLNYGVPDRVFLDRILLSIHLQQRMADLINIQDNYRKKISNENIRNQLINMVQNDINKLYGIWNGLSSYCRPVSFKEYSAHVNADVKYKDILSGEVGLMRAENGFANFTNVPYSEIEGQVKATTLIYRK